MAIRLLLRDGAEPAATPGGGNPKGVADSGSCSTFVDKGSGGLGCAPPLARSGAPRGSPQTVQNFDVPLNCVPHRVQKTVLSAVMASALSFPAMARPRDHDVPLTGKPATPTGFRRSTRVPSPSSPDSL